eukprot:6205463-Pleurochrysis_carterae.AAC.1
MRVCSADFKSFSVLPVLRRLGSWATVGSFAYCAVCAHYCAVSARPRTQSCRISGRFSFSSPVSISTVEVE